MRVLHLSKYDLRGGAAIAAFNSVVSQRAAGIDARLAVGRKLSKSDFVDGPNRLRQLRVAMSFAVERLPFRILGVPSSDVRSIGLGGLDVADIISRHDPDVIVLHSIDGFIPLKALPKINRPVVWRMHDMWPALGTRHYAENNDRLVGIAALLDDWTLKRKHHAYAGLSNLTLCPPSHWLGSVSASSPLLKRLPCVVIPNGVDTRLFHPADKQAARAMFGLDPSAKIVAFGAIGGTTDPRKGADLLLGALRAGAPFFSEHNVEFLFFGGGREPEQIDGVRLISAGPIASRERMAMVYRAADVAVVPSRMENLSLTVLEAMACATPVVAFKIGGMPDMIEPGVSGWLAPEVSYEALLATMVEAVTQCSLDGGIGHRARRTVETRFSLETEASAMIELYASLLGERKLS